MIAAVGVLAAIVLAIVALICGILLAYEHGHAWLDQREADRDIVTWIDGLLADNDDGGRQVDRALLRRKAER